MLLVETRKWDIRTKVLDPAKDAPGRLATNEFVCGSFRDFDTVYNFGKGVDCLTIEIESVNVDALEKLESEGVKVFPQPHVIRTIQNKITQKQFYAEHGIPTAHFEVFSGRDQLQAAVNNGKIKLPFVWKVAQGGYDGFGVGVVRESEKIAELPDQACIAEELVPFEMEISVVVARNAHGDLESYPPVEMAFHPEANQAEYVICPANLDETLTRIARGMAIRVAEQLEICGLLAVEMFVTKDGIVLVNEVAPRPHNSGHLTIEGNYTSQFEQHLRAILGLPLGSTQMKCPAVMVNLVGSEGHTGPVEYKGYEDLLARPGVNIHVYGKSETRPFRKMGHVTVIAPTVDEACELAGKAKKEIEVIAAK